MDTNTVQLINSFGDKLDSYISALASKAGVAADHFYPVFVKQQAIEGWCGVLLFVLIAIFCLVFLTMALRNVGPASSMDEKIFVPAIAKTVVGFLVSIVLFCFTLGTGSELGVNISKIYNPEYSAVQALVKMVK